jgi:hypothetical protein
MDEKFQSIELSVTCVKTVSLNRFIKWRIEIYKTLPPVVIQYEEDDLGMQ